MPDVGGPMIFPPKLKLVSKLPVKSPFFVTAAMNRRKILAGIDPPSTPPETPRKFIMAVADCG
jgi:hypothetical protein